MAKRMRRFGNRTLHSGQPHFLCLATPGAGKTIMAAELAATLFDKG